ncbi:MAG: HAD family acid phosphatase [Alphaproteobacteria bacterium]|nr:HAD family acid phosphatase [Alphaproteobacteria bacterium]
MKKIPTIYCDIDGVVLKKFPFPIWDKFGEPNENMIRVIKTLAHDFNIIFITGRWNIYQEKTESLIRNLFPDINCKVFCKPCDYPGSTAEYKVSVVKDLESQGYDFHLGLDDHGTIVRLLHHNGMLVAQVVG